MRAQLSTFADIVLSQCAQVQIVQVDHFGFLIIVPELGVATSAFTGSGRFL